MPDPGYSLDDFRRQLQQMKKLGTMREVLKMIPDLKGWTERLEGMDPDRDARLAQGIIDSMTPAERREPDLIAESQRCRIAGGSGTEPRDVEKLIRDFLAMRSMMEQFAGMPLRERIRRVRLDDPEDGPGNSSGWRWN
jgi:signal recognition particle subunit SRP54